MNILGKRSDLHFHARAIARRRKARFPLLMCRILFAAKHSWTVLRMSRPLFVVSCCRSRGGLSANEKKEKFASNNNKSYYLPKMHYGWDPFAVEEQKIHKMNKNVMSHYWYSKIANIFSKTSIQATSSGEKVKKQLKFKEQMKEISKAQCQNNV